MATTTARWRPGRADAVRILRAVERRRPRDDDALHALVARELGLLVPRRALIGGHDAPFDYLRQAFFGPDDPARPDLVVWANRGGGKTMLAAVATLLDLVFKPAMRICLLGGSFDQSSRMYAHLRRLFGRPAVSAMLAGEPTQKRLTLINGSCVRLLHQSQRSVRGIHVHRLRCDEVELFDPEVWEAAQFVTHSGTCGRFPVRGGIDAISTMHRSGGLMSKLVRRQDATVLRWSALDVAQRCDERLHDCAACPLWDDCRGRARHAEGFLPIADLLATWRRTDDDTWAAEMMCRRPGVRDRVYPSFDPARHVVATAGPWRGRTLIAGLDLGLRNPLAYVLATVGEAQRADEAVVEVIAEYTEAGRTLDDHIDTIASRGWPSPAWVSVDPAADARVLQTGSSDLAHLRQRGWRVRAVRAAVDRGLQVVRRRLDRGTLRLSASCPKLAEAMMNYHYPARRQGDEKPVKDGPDHLCDALRYMLVALEHGGGAVQSRAW